MAPLREGGREGGREGEREGGRKGGREEREEGGGREGGREGGKEDSVAPQGIHMHTQRYTPIPPSPPSLSPSLTWPG